MRIRLSVPSVLAIIATAFLASGASFSATNPNNKKQTAAKAAPKARVSSTATGTAGGNASKNPAGRQSSNSRTSGTARGNRLSANARSFSSGRGGGAPALTGNSDRDCRYQYTYCMDSQIAGYINRYPYLAGDDAAAIVMESSEPLRCIYYQHKNVAAMFSEAGLNKYCSAADIAKRSSLKDNGRATNKKKYNNLNFCADQRDINELYMAYNYYCDLTTSNMDAYGQAVRRCNIANGKTATTAEKTAGKESAVLMSNAFATRASYAYYKEALRRTEEGELKMINFEHSVLWKQKLEPILSDCEIGTSLNGLSGDKPDTTAYDENCAEEAMKNWNMFSLSGGGVSKTGTGANAKINVLDNDTGTDAMGDIFEDLGLVYNNTELFSVNVAPPAGAGTLNPAVIFKSASDLCFSGVKLNARDKEIAGNSADLQKSVDALKRCASSYSRADLERYYLTSLWFEQCDDGYTLNETSGKCVLDEDPAVFVAAMDTSGGTAEGLTLKESDFMSAKKSCDMYETALISTRNAIYGEFDTALKNYIEDNIAKLISKKSKDMKTIAKSFMGLKELNANIEADMMRMKAQARTAKTQAMMDIMQADLDLKDLRHEIAMRALEQSKERAKMYGEIYAAQIKAACMPKIQASVAFACGVDDTGAFNWINCGGGDSRNFMNYNKDTGSQTATLLANALANQSVFIDKKGNVVSADPTMQGGSFKMYGASTAGNVTTISNQVVTGADGKVRVDDVIIGEAGDFERIFCAHIPGFKDKLMLPLRADVNAVYNHIFRINCTGDATVMATTGAASATKFGSDFLETTLKSEYNYDCHSRNKKGGCSASSSTLKEDKVKFAYIGGDGKCYGYVEQTATSGGGYVQYTGSSGQSRSSSNYSVPHPEWATEHLDRGYEVFDKAIMPAFEAAAKD